MSEVKVWIKVWSRQWGEGLDGLAAGIDVGKFMLYKPGHQWTITFRYDNKGIPGWYIWHAKKAILLKIVDSRFSWHFPRIRLALVRAYHRLIQF